MCLNAICKCWTPKVTKGHGPCEELQHTKGPGAHFGQMLWQCFASSISERCGGKFWGFGFIMVPEFPRDVFRLQFPPNWTYRCGMPTREGGWLVRFFLGGMGKQMEWYSIQKVYLVLGLFEPARELFLTIISHAEFCQCQHFPNFWGIFFADFTTQLVCFASASRTLGGRGGCFRLGGWGWSSTSTGMCLDGIWLFQLLWLRLLMQTVCRLEGVFSKLQSFGMVKY